MFSYACNAGRLVEVRLGAPVSVEDVEGIGAAARRLMLARDERFVCAVDLRDVSVLPPDAAESLLAGLRSFNPRIERTAVLLPELASTLVLQIERVHREAGTSMRRTFRDASILRLWLKPVLTPDEQAALERFLD